MLILNGRSSLPFNNCMNVPYHSRYAPQRASAGKGGVCVAKRNVGVLWMWKTPSPTLTRGRQGNKKPAGDRSRNQGDSSEDHAEQGTVLSLQHRQSYPAPGMNFFAFAGVCVCVCVCVYVCKGKSSAWRKLTDWLAGDNIRRGTLGSIPDQSISQPTHILVDRERSKICNILDTNIRSFVQYQEVEVEKKMMAFRGLHCFLPFNNTGNGKLRC
jgi:hypothetical protein